MDDPNLKSEMESYKIENENLKRHNERITIDYELKLECLKKEVELKTSNYETLMNNYQEIETKFKNGCDDKISLNQTYHDLSKEKFELVKKFNTLETDYSTITELISRRENELLLAKNEISELRSKIDAYKTSEIEIKLSERDLEFRHKDIVKIEEMSLTRNKRLCDDIKILQEKLAEANKELFEERSKNNSNVFDLNIELENKRNEIKNQKKLNEKLKENISYLEKVYEEKTESLRSALEGKNNVDSILRKDLNVQKSITELYKAERDELFEKQNTLIQTITELQDAFRDNCEESTKMKEECEVKLEEYECRVTELRRSLNEKEKELENANELLEKFRVKSLSEDELRLMNPATAAAIGALKRGYSLTQIYSEYLQVASERNELKADRDRLNEYIRSILEDIEEKAPSIRKQQEERCNMELTVATFGQKYDRTLSDLFNCQAEIEELRRKCEDQSQKLKREEQTSSDLSRQVCCLLREIESSRGTVIRSDGDGKHDSNQSLFMNSMRSANQRSILRQSNSSLISNNSSIDVANRMTTANDVITTHLVTFKSICELQKQNIQLLEQLRDLSAQQESQESLLNEHSLQQVAKKLETACAEVDQLREKVKTQRQLEKIIDRQRHIIQALTMLTGNNDLAMILNKTPLSIDCSDEASQSLISYNERDKLMTCNIDNNRDLKQKISDYEKKITKLQSTVDKLKDEKDSMKDFHSKAIEDVNKQIAESKSAIESVLAKLSYNQEKASTLEQNLVNRQLEMTDLQNELSAANSELSQRKEELKAMKSELLSSQSLAKSYEITINDMQKNMKHIESLEQQIQFERSEKYELMRGTNNLAIQISNLQSLVVASRSEDLSEEQQDLKIRIKQLSLELKQEKSKYQTSQEMWQAKLNESGVKIDTLSAQLSTVGKSNVIPTTDTRVNVEHQKSPEKREKMSNLEEQIEDLSIANKNLKKQLESYEEILSTSEFKLRTNSELMTQLQNEFQQNIDEERKKCKDLEETFACFQHEHDKLEIEYKSVKETLENKILTLEGSLEENNQNSEALNEQLSQLKEKEALLKSDLDRQRQLTKEAMGNYQQELIFHAQESDSLQEINEMLHKYQAQERDQSQKLKEAILDRDQFKLDAESKDSVWNTERAAFQNEIEELRVQKECLYGRLIDLNDLVVNLKKMLDPTVEGVVSQAVIQQESDWNEVIQYLRQEKENAETAKNQLEMEVYRLRNENSAHEDTIAQLNNTLAEERKFKVIESETSKQHSEVMRKLETVQMLTESNALMRQDRERLKEDLADKIKKVASLHDVIEPLKSELKSYKNDVDSVRLEMRSLENERDLWRQRCDSLLEKSKQINPDDFKKLCIEKDELAHSVLVEEEKCKKLQETVDELQQTITSQTDSLKEVEENLDEIRRANDDNLNGIQKRDVMISQLKDLGRRYKAEKELLKAEIDRISEAKEGQSRELQNVRTELSSSKASLVESQQKLKVHSDCAGTSQMSVGKQQSMSSENTFRVKIIENQLSTLKTENEALKSENESLQSQVSNYQKLLSSQESGEEVLRSDDNNVTSEVSQASLAPSNHSTVASHSAPTVARVAANVHPVIQKPSTQGSMASGSNQISPSSLTTSCQSTARQTAEIRPISAVMVHPSTLSTSTSDQNMDTISVTTSLPANVVQALAASSVSTVIFPSALTLSASTLPSAVNSIRMKRRLNEATTSDVDSSILTEVTDTTVSSAMDNSPLSKKMRFRGATTSREEIISEDSGTAIPDMTVQSTSNDVNSFLEMIDAHEVELPDGGNEMNLENDEDIDDVDLEVDEEDEEEEEDEDEGNMSEQENYAYNTYGREENNDESDEDDEEEEDDDDDDDEPVCIELSSDGQSEDDTREDNANMLMADDNGNMDSDGDDDDNEAPTDGGMSSGVRTASGAQSEVAEARTKIEPITWPGTLTGGSSVPPMAGQPIRAMGHRRKTNMAHRGSFQAGPFRRPFSRR